MRVSTADHYQMVISNAQIDSLRFYGTAVHLLTRTNECTPLRFIEDRPGMGRIVYHIQSKRGRFQKPSYRFVAFVETELSPGE